MVESTVDLRVVNARVVTPDGTINGSVAANDGIIVGVGTESNLPEADREIDAEGNYLIPGFIDPHVHWGLSRYEFDYHEGLEHDFETETRGAIHGGVTTVANFLLQRSRTCPTWTSSSGRARKTPTSTSPTTRSSTRTTTSRRSRDSPTRGFDPTRSSSTGTRTPPRTRDRPLRRGRGLQGAR